MGSSGYFVLYTVFFCIVLRSMGYIFIFHQTSTDRAPFARNQTMSSDRASPTFVGKVKPHVTEDRLTDSMGVPGPGKYYNPTKMSSFGKQQKSQKKSMATAKFGTSKRAGIQKVCGKEQAAKNPLNIRRKWVSSIYQA